jgi:hypothetical protein
MRCELVHYAQMYTFVKRCGDISCARRMSQMKRSVIKNRKRQRSEVATVPENNARVTWFAVAFALLVNLSGIAIVTVAAALGSAPPFEAVMLGLFNTGVTVAQVLSVVYGHFGSNMGRVERQRNAFGFWLAYWICIFILLIINYQFLVLYWK